MTLAAAGAGAYFYLQPAEQAAPQPAIVEPVVEPEPEPIVEVTPEPEPVDPDLIEESGDKPLAYDPYLADLGTRPDYNQLGIYQETITRSDFERLLTKVYVVGDSWKEWISLFDDRAEIRSNRHQLDEIFTLRFAPEQATQMAKLAPKFWQKAAELPATTIDKPLADLVIAIDPGHIGGDYAQIEERWYQIDDHCPVMEGEMVLVTAEIIKSQLENLGAKVYLVRDENAPVSQLTIDDYQAAAAAKVEHFDITTPEATRKLQERYLYRTGEIRARAELVNTQITPDLVLCLHFNAEAWDDPSNPTLTDKNHNHTLLHGALTKSEIAHDDERYEMLLKILQGVHDEEKEIGKAAVTAMSKHTGLPNYEYEKNSRRAISVDNFPGLWARNLLANRLYQCPVIFYEPYVMNNEEVHARVQAGDFEGEQEVFGKMRRSIFREYADAVTEGLVKHYAGERKIDKASQNLSE